MKNRTKNILKFIIGISILVILFTRIGFRDMIYIIPQANFMILLIALIPFLIALVAAASNIQILLVGLKKRIKFIKIIKYYLLSWGAGLLLPGKLGDFTIIYFLKKDKVPIGQGTAVSIVDKFISTITLFIIGSFGFFLFFEKNQALKLMLMSVALIFLVVFVVINPYTKKIVKKVFGNKLDIFKGFSDSINTFAKKRKKVLVLNTLITLVQWVLSAVSISLIFLAFKVNVPIKTILLISAITTVMSLIPITVAGIGIKESVGVFLYTGLGYNATIVASVHLIILIQKYLVAFISYMIYRF